VGFEGSKEGNKCVCVWGGGLKRCQTPNKSNSKKNKVAVYVSPPGGYHKSGEKEGACLGQGCKLPQGEFHSLRSSRSYEYKTE